nr:hypothetical protein [uncultured bacterium]
MSDTYRDWGADDFEQLSKIQNLASEIDISNIYDFVNIFRPNVLFYFFRNQSENNSFKWRENATLLSTQILNDLKISEYKIGNTIIFHLPHPNYLVKGHAQAWKWALL